MDRDTLIIAGAAIVVLLAWLAIVVLLAWLANRWATRREKKIKN